MYFSFKKSFSLFFLLTILALFLPLSVNAQTTPTCDQPAQVALADTTTPSLTAGETVSNQFIITNPNPASCGSTLYGISRGYPAGWTLTTASLSATVAAGSSESIPFSLTASTSAAVGTYSYSLYAGDGYTGVLQEAKGYVAIVAPQPVCNLTVQARLADTTVPSVNPGESVSNQLLLTNPNPASCGTNTYLISRGYPYGWSMSISNSVIVNGGETTAVPFSLSVSPSSPLGSYTYNLYAYNSWADGSGTASVGSSVNVVDTIAPLVTITNPADSSFIPRNKTVQISATATDSIQVAKVEFYINGALQCTDTTSSYTCSFTTPNRKGLSYNLTAKAYDAAGNTATSTVNVTTK